MVAYVTITDAELSPGAPTLSSQATRFRDNAAALSQPRQTTFNSSTTHIVTLEQATRGIWGICTGGGGGGYVSGASAPGTGGTSSFGAFASATGGVGGTNTETIAGGVGTTGAILLRGGRTGVIERGTEGGASYWGYAEPRRTTDGNGINGVDRGVGGGGRRASSTDVAGGGGGGTAIFFIPPESLTVGQSIPVTIGAGGAGSVSGGNTGGNGVAGRIVIFG